MSTEVGAAQPSGRREEKILRLDFECLQSIPGGGINEVRLWWDPLLGCHRVGKRIDISGMEHDEVLPEAATLQMIDHPNVLKVVAAATLDGYPKPMHVIELVTPYLRRGSITDALLRGERFTASQAVGVVQAALRGLAELHEVHGIAHRDIKSGNILLTEDHTVATVADLGLAGLFDDAGAVPALNNPTLYSPPELVLTGVLSRASDLYPLALVLRELLGGNFPYAEYTTAVIHERLIKGKVPVKAAHLTLPVWTPRALRRVINKAGHPSASMRYTTAREMDDALAAAKVADWHEVDAGRWEAGFVHDSTRAVRVDAVALKSGGWSMQTRVDRGRGWRRVTPDVVVAGVDSAAARGVFDHATAIANVR